MGLHSFLMQIFLLNQGAYLIRIHPSSSDLVNKCWVLRVFSCPVQNNHPPFLFFFFPTQKNEWFSIGLYCILNRLRTVIQITTCLDCDIFPPHWVPFSLHWHENTGWKVHSVKAVVKLQSTSQEFEEEGSRISTHLTPGPDVHASLRQHSLLHFCNYNKIHF